MQDPMGAITPAPPGAAMAWPAKARPSLSGAGASFRSTRAPRPRSASANASQALRAGRARVAFKRAITASNAANSASASALVGGGVWRSTGVILPNLLFFIKEYS